MRLFLYLHFSSYVPDPVTIMILLHEDNQAVVHVLNSMVSASKPMIVEMRKLQVLLRSQGVNLESLWVPSAVNRFLDSLSSTWDSTCAQLYLYCVRSGYSTSFTTWCFCSALWAKLLLRAGNVSQFRGRRTGGRPYTFM